MHTEEVVDGDVSNNITTYEYFILAGWETSNVFSTFDYGDYIMIPEIHKSSNTETNKY